MISRAMTNCICNDKEQNDVTFFYHLNSMLRDDVKNLKCFGDDESTMTHLMLLSHNQENFFY